MLRRLLAPLVVTLALAGAPKQLNKTVATATGENQEVALTVTLYLDPADVERLVGDNLDKHFILAEVKFEPRNGKDVLVDRDEFLLRTDSNGAHATPFAPSQIAGGSPIILREADEGEAKAAASAGPFGFPGRKRTESKKSGDSKKGKAAEPAKPEAAARPADKEKALEQALKDKELPQKKTSQPVSGLLYFGMEKQKMKDLSVTYGPKDDLITLRFK